jgi:hypothetical protein
MSHRAVTAKAADGVGADGLPGAVVGTGRALVDIDATAADVFEPRRTVATDAARSVLTGASVAAPSAVERALVYVGADLPVAVPSGGTAAHVGAVFTAAGGIGITATGAQASDTARVDPIAAAAVARVARIAIAAADAGTGPATATAPTGATGGATVDLAAAAARGGSAAAVITATSDEHDNRRDVPSSCQASLPGSNRLPRVTGGSSFVWEDRARDRRDGVLQSATFSSVEENMAFLFPLTL